MNRNIKMLGKLLWKKKISLKDFDILGIIELKDIQGIEKYVTPVIVDGKLITYISRSKEYYNVKNMEELSLERESLKRLLTNRISKRNFVIVENMLNCSGKVYFKKFEQYIESGKRKDIEVELKQAEECLMEDIKNILVTLEGKGNISKDFQKRLPSGFENSIRRSIEMDNKAMLYIFAKSLKDIKQPENIEILTPGYGSIYIGPILKAMYGCDFTNMFKSKYIEETKKLQPSSVRELMSSERIFEGNKTILLLDDNIGTGATMEEIKQNLKEAGINSTIISGAVQYNWRNYYRISIGEKKDIKRPKIGDFDIVTPINYAGHKLYEHAISQLLSSGEEYIKYLQSKSYKQKDSSDLKGAIQRGITNAKISGLELNNNSSDFIREKKKDKEEILEQYRQEIGAITNPIANKIIQRILEEIRDLEPNIEAKR